MTDRIRLGGLLLGELSLVGGLHALARADGFRVGWTDLGGWLEKTPFEEAAGSAILVVALALAYWLLASTVAYLVARASGPPRLLRAVRWVTLPPIRRLAGRAVAISIAASTAGGPLVSAIADPAGSDRVSVVVEVGPHGQLRPPGTQDTVPDDGASIVLPPHLVPRARPVGPDPELPPAEQPAQLDGTVEHRITVRRGDHMWTLSEQHLRQVTGKADVGEHEIARYWVRVVGENRGRIRSGNPDLIYPGETLVLPPVRQ